MPYGVPFVSMCIKNYLADSLLNQFDLTRFLPFDSKFNPVKFAHQLNAVTICKPVRFF